MKKKKNFIPAQNISFPFYLHKTFHFHFTKK